MNTQSDFPLSMGKVAPRELIQNGIKNLNDCTKYSDKELLAVHGVGPKAVRVIKSELAKKGKSLKVQGPTTHQKTKSDKHRIYSMSVASVYPFYVQKAEKKSRTKAEVDEIIHWLTGYSKSQIDRILKDETDFETFFTNAPKLNPSRKLITGVICGVRVEEIKEPIMQEIRYLDKLIDELARGKQMEKILRK